MAFNESDITRDRVGKFSEKVGSAPGLSLSRDRDMKSVQLDVEWTERDVIPPRMRKPRDVQHILPLEVNIPIVDAADAPVAIRFKDQHFLAGEYRVHGGQLYTKSKVSADDAETYFEQGYRGASSDEGSEESVRADMQSRASQLRIIDDEIWSPAPEPVYTVNTYGMGGNHGGTSLSIDAITRYKTEGDRPVSDHVFPLDQREEAIAKALEVAEGRGDNQSYDSIKNAEKPELSGDFTPGSTFTQAPRIKYTAAYELPYGASQEEVEAAFTDFKKQLLTVPGAVYDVADGWGGTTKRVDFTKLTEMQASHYKDYAKRVEGLGDR